MPEIGPGPKRASSAFATAAVFFFVLASSPKPVHQGMIALVPEPESITELEETDQAVTSMTDLLADKFQPQVSIATDSSKTSDIVSHNVETIAIVKPLSAKPLSASPMSAEKLAPTVAFTDVKPTNQNQGLASIPGMSPEVFLTMVLDITLDNAAIENRALETVLEKYGIVYANDLNINAEQVKALEESRLVLEESRLVAAANAKVHEKIGVMFLRSTAEKISLAMTDISDQYKDFPEFSLSMSFDKSAGLLVKQLSGIKVAEGASGVARRLLPPNSNSATPFTALARVTTSDRKADAKRSVRNPAFPELSNGIASGEMSNALLLLRTSK